MDGKKLRRAGFCGLAVLLAAGVVVYLLIPKEPSYQGRTLTQWLEWSTEDSRYLYIFASDRPDPDFLSTRAAVQAMGTNAIPFLLEWSCASNSKAGAKIISWLNKHLSERHQIWDAQQRQVASDMGFGLLGDKARSAWPLFVQWTYDKNPERRSLGLHLLVTTKADKEITLPVLRRLVDDSFKPMRDAAAYVFCYYYRKDAIAEGVYQKFPEWHLNDFPSPDVPSRRPGIPAQATPDLQ
jgi:hypothetical protein